MTPNSIVITQALKRNRLSLKHMASSVFGDEAGRFLAFMKNPKHSNFNITYKHLSLMATKLQIPFGYLFLEKLPKENAKIPELRRKNLDLPISNTLKESVKNSEYKQLWYRDYLISIGQEANFIKKYNDKDKIIAVIKNLTKFNTLLKNDFKAFQGIIDKLQNKNCLVFVASNIDRKK